MSKGIPVAKITARYSVTHQYRYFYYLANELAYLAQQDTHKNNAYRYTVGAVVMSFTTIETFFNDLLHASEYPVKLIYEGMSPGLRVRIEHMSLNDKIEFVLRFHPSARPTLLTSGSEPYQSFDLLRQLRNLLVHYKPDEDLVWSDDGAHIRNTKRLERALAGKFHFKAAAQVDLDGARNAFLYRILNRDCARWAFCCVAPFIKALCEALGISPVNLDVHWPIDHTV